MDADIWCSERIGMSGRRGCDGIPFPQLLSGNTYSAAQCMGIDAVSMGRLFKWENEILHALEKEGTVSSGAEEFLEYPTYGDGGMAAAVRIGSQLNTGKDREHGKG